MLKNVETSAPLYVGDILTSSWGTTGVEVLKEVYVDVLNQYRFIVRDVRITNNEKTASTDPSLNLYTSADLRAKYGYKWTKDTFTFKPGDVFKDDKGDMYIAQTKTIVWNLNRGVYATVTPAGLWSYEKVQLKKHVTAGGEDFSGHLPIKSSY